MTYMSSCFLPAATMEAKSVMATMRRRTNFMFALVIEWPVLKVPRCFGGDVLEAMKE